jgi:hypothetical protein
MTSAAMGQRVDTEKLRAALRHMSRGNLLSIANRAIELVPRARLGSLVAGIVRLDLLSEGTSDAASLLDEVRTFHDACLHGDYYESFDVNSKNYMDTSKGTDAFIVEFERLIDKCIRASAKGRSSTVREAFELLFALLLSISLARSIVRLRISRTMTGRSIWLPHGAWPAQNRKWHFGLYLPVSSADHDGPDRPLEGRIHGELCKDCGGAIDGGSIFASPSETKDWKDAATISRRSPGGRRSDAETCSNTCRQPKARKGRTETRV